MTPWLNSCPHATMLLSFSVVGEPGSFLAEDSKALPASSLGLEGGQQEGGLGWQGGGGVGVAS